MQPVAIAQWSTLENRKPTAARVSNVDLVIIRYDGEGESTNHSVLYGRCLHRGAPMADGYLAGDDLICGLHGWDYQIRTGVSSYNNTEVLEKFSSWIEADQVMVDAEEILAWEKVHPQPYDRNAYQGSFQDVHGTPEEPHVGLIRKLSNDGLSKMGHHGPVTSMASPEINCLSGRTSSSSPPSLLVVHCSTMNRLLLKR